MVSRSRKNLVTSSTADGTEFGGERVADVEERSLAVGEVPRFHRVVAGSAQAAARPAPAGAPPPPPGPPTGCAGVPGLRFGISFDAAVSAAVSTGVSSGVTFSRGRRRAIGELHHRELLLLDFVQRIAVGVDRGDRGLVADRQRLPLQMFHSRR